MLSGAAGLVMMAAAGAEAAPVAIPHGNVELLAEKESIEAGRTVSLGLRFELEKGWHIYWVNPGDSGEPPKVNWTLPEGWRAGTMEWPTPRRLGTASVRDFGYEDSVMLLVPMRAGDRLQTKLAEISGNLSVLVCREMCIPGKARVTLTLPVKGGAPAADRKNAALFEQARKSLPKKAPANWEFSAADAGDSFVLTGLVGKQVKEAVFFPLEPSQVDNAAEQKVAPTAGGFRLTLKKSMQLLKPVETLKGVIVVGQGEAYELEAGVGKAASQ